MKLHIGGTQVKEGWLLINIQRLPGVDHVGSVSDLSRFEDQSVDEVYASHVLEHVPQNKMISTLRGLYRVIKADGRLLISVPDLDVLCRSMLDPALSGDQKLHVMRMIYGAQQDEFDYHYFGWNLVFMTSFLNHVGFTSVEKVPGFGLFEDTSDFTPYGVPISLNVIAIKPASSG